MKKRYEYIDLTKLLAILFIIMSHTNILPDRLNIFFNSFYIVVFFVCTGYTFNVIKTSSYKNLFSQITKLIKYYLFYSFILLVIYSSFSLIKGTFTIAELVNNIIGIFYCRYTYYIGCKTILMGVGNAPMWFIGCYIFAYSLFFILMKYKESKLQWYMLVFVILGYFLSVINFLFPWSLDTVPYMCFFICLGYSIKKLGLKHFEQLLLLIVMLSALIIMNIFSPSINLSLKNYGFNYFYTLIMGIFGSVSLIIISKYLCLSKIIKEISNYGKYTLDMMCYHLLIIFAISFIFHGYLLIILSNFLIVVLSPFVNYILRKFLRI